MDQITFQIRALTLSILFCTIQNLFAQLDELTLPAYQLEIDTSYLTILYDDPITDEYFPANFSFGEHQYDCEVRFRGGTSRLLPKKSWRIKFNDDNNIWGVTKLNLNAEYRDRSQMRNYLSMKLFQYLDYPAPNTEFVGFFVNNIYMGVYIEVEEVDEYFLKRNDLEPDNLYKAKDHGASMAPLVKYNHYAPEWDKKLGKKDNYSDIQMLFSKFIYWTNEDFESSIANEVNIDNILNYFAVEFVLASFDCFTKNIYLYHNPEEDYYEIFPWDNDATYGNDWKGDFNLNFADFYYGRALRNQVLFQRLMENEAWRNDFFDKVNVIITEGFSFLSIEMDATYNHIKNDVYQDTSKICSNQEFDSEMIRINNYLTERASFLDGFTYFDRIPLSEYYCSNPCPDQYNQDVTFRVTSEQEQGISVEIVTNMDFDEWGSSYDLLSVDLYDDGNHNDIDAGDLIYGNTITINEEGEQILPYCFTTFDYNYPANGLFYVDRVRTNTFALMQKATPQNIDQSLNIGNVYKIRDDIFIQLYNSSSTEIDLSYYIFQSGKYYQNIIIPENFILPGFDTLIITNNIDLSEYYFNQLQSLENLFFDIEVGDTLKILTPTLTSIIEKTLSGFSQLNSYKQEIVINEINYHSSDDFDPDDWVEIYNPQFYPVDLSYWYLTDSENDHIFLFPVNTILNPDEYLVLCEDRSKFHIQFPDVRNCLGDFDFSLKNSGETINLYNLKGLLIDFVTYDDEQPWPVEPDGGGSTLELINPKLDNYKECNWKASYFNGTPGEQNSVFIKQEDDTPNKYDLYQNAPNPFTQSTTIVYMIPEPSYVLLKVYDIFGREVKTLVDDYQEADFYFVNYHPEDNSEGIYFYNLQVGGSFSEVKKMLIVR